MNAAEHDLIVSLHESYAVAMEQYAFRMTGDEKLAQDLVQETFLTAIIKIDAVFAHNKPQAWLFKTLRYIMKREIDLSYRKAEVPMEETETFSFEGNLASSLEEVLPGSLPKSERELLILRYEKQWSYDAIAEYKGIKPAACRKQVSRAVQHFREELEKEKTLSQKPVLNRYT